VRPKLRNGITETAITEKWCLVRIATALIATAACAAQREPAPPGYPRVYEYTYEHNTPALVENHYIVLDSAAGGIRGWYFGTTDDFDSAREGYLPGFFVAPMEDLRLSGDAIAFTLRPRELFASPVPLRYRDPAEIPRELRQQWTGPALQAEARSYSGTVAADRITLDVDRKPRLFVRVERGK
jgi:hypothetical protein